jgi:hypothetical protein
LVPPNPGTDGCVALKVGPFWMYHVGFGADGQVTNNGTREFKVKKPVLEFRCDVPPLTDPF